MQRTVLIGAGLLGLAIIVIIGNTIRLEIQNRRDEIRGNQAHRREQRIRAQAISLERLLVRAVRFALILALVWYGLFLLQPTVERLAGLYQSGIAVLALDARDSLTIIGTGIGLGLVGSWFAAARHMRAIEPK